MNILLVGSADVGVLSEMARTTFEQTFRGTLPDRDMQEYLASAYSAETIQRELADPESEVFFAEVEGVPAGYLKLNVGDAQTEPMAERYAEIQRIYVVAEFQGRGLGTALIEHAKSWARAKDRSTLWLGVWEHNDAALAFYHRHGFTRIGEHPFITGSVVYIDWILALDLDAR